MNLTLLSFHLYAKNLIHLTKSNLRHNFLGNILNADVRILIEGTQGA